jgi:hypothetical protein
LPGKMFTNFVDQKTSVVVHWREDENAANEKIQLLSL